MLTLKTVTFFEAHVCLKRLCPISFIDHFYYEIDVCDVIIIIIIIIIQTQLCIFLDALFTRTCFGREENIYSGTVNTDML